MSIDYSPAAACRGCKKSVDAKSAYFCPTCGDCICAGLRKEKQRRLSPLFFAAGKIQLILPGPLPRPVFFNSSDLGFCARKESQKGISKAVASDRKPQRETALPARARQNFLSPI